LIHYHLVEPSHFFTSIYIHFPALFALSTRPQVAVIPVYLRRPTRDSAHQNIEFWPSNFTLEAYLTFYLVLTVKMASFNRTSSPVLTMTPGAVHQSAFGMPSFAHQPSPLSRNGTFGATPSWPAMASASSLTAGRKRSRDEAAINLDVEEAKLETIDPIKEKDDDWVYGEGMTLIKSPSSYVTNAGSQSGTWVEEKAATDEACKNADARAINQQARPSLRSNKSQRLDMNATSIPGNNSQASRVSPVRDVSPSASTPGLSIDASSQPIVDNFTLHLGIGWSRISEDEHIQAAARGWARFIENHFPVTNVRIQLESKGLQSYFVESSEGYFLFAENLRQGQLVSKDLHQAFSNLKATPPTFEGLQVMAATESPAPMDSTSQEVDMVLN
jgi:hypothetical protein